MHTPRPLLAAALAALAAWPAAGLQPTAFAAPAAAAAPEAPLPAVRNGIPPTVSAEWEALAAEADATRDPDRLLDVQRRLRESKSALEEANRTSAQGLALARHLGAVRREGSFWVDEEGRPIAIPHAERPANEARRPQSHREKLERLGISLPASARSLTPRRVPEKPAAVEVADGFDPTIVLFKFVDEEPVRLRAGRLAPQGRAADAWSAILAKYEEAALGRAFTTEERILDENRESGQLLSGGELPDLNNWYLARLPEGSTRGPAQANELLALDAIEIAYLQGRAEPPICLDQTPETPSFTHLQTYREPAPEGLDSNFANTYHAGGDGPGASFWVIDLEWGWCSHEDLPISQLDIVNGSTGFSSTDHGTAVLGIYGACAGAWGMTGMTPDIEMKMADFDSEPSWASNIATADSFLDPGEVMLLEIHIPGPDSFTSCPCNCSQFEFVPVEWDQASFDAISTATANGVIVVEAAGNGSMNLDHARYQNKFQRWFRDSGAILVAATEPDHDRTCWSNFGSRVDVHAIGESVASTGYGEHWTGNPANCQQEYTLDFGGTSSASPMIVGAAIALQGITKQKWGYTMWPSVMRDRIDVGGTPSPDSGVGLMPDLEAAIHGLEPDWYPDSPGNWAFPAVPRALDDATLTNAPFVPAPLPGAPFGCRECETYFNWASRLSPSTLFGSVVGSRTALRLDDGFLWECFGGTGVPGSYQYCLNVGTEVKGGRHTVHVESDYLNQETEGNESNNDWYRQFIWSGQDLDEGQGLTSSADPPASTAGALWYNAQGIEGTRLQGHWHAFAALPTNAQDDVDVRLNTEVPLNIPMQGFGAYVNWSSDVAGRSDFVVMDATELGVGTSWASVLWLAGPGADKKMQFQRDEGTLVGTGTWGPFSMSAQDIVILHELLLDPGTYDVTITPVSGTADVGASVYPGTGGRFAKDEVLGAAYADDVLGLGAETVELRILSADRYGLAVWKARSADASRVFSYTVTVQPSSSVGVDAADELPAALALAAPRPNPSAGSTSIVYDVPAGGSTVDLAIYDLAGRRVAELARGTAPAGRHRVQWDGRDANDRSVAAGIYFVRMTAGSEIFTRKITRLP